MKRIYNSTAELIGNTPILRLKKIEEKYNLNAELFAKLESFNPTGSAKDRAALSMLLSAERDEKITEGGTIIEPTSGNTGIALAALAAAKGYRAIIVMPGNMSRERQLFIKAYGAEIELTDPSLGMKGAIARAEELSREIPNSFIPCQFDNENNKSAHYLTTGPEIYDALSGNIDIFIAAVGTGGTLSGVGEFLKEKNEKIKVIAVEPKESPLISGGTAAPHKIQGIGANFIPSILNKDIYDEVITVSADEAYNAAREAGKSLGLGIGISSGAALAAAIRVAVREECRGMRIALIFPDGIDRYLSTDLFD